MTVDLADRIHALSNAAASELIELEDELAIIRNALVSRSHVFFCGGPGIAKSFAPKRVFVRIEGARLSHTEMFPQAPDSALLGPMSLPAFKAGRYERVFDGYVPGCELSIIDELPNANASTLMSLHSSLNERQIMNAGVRIDLPVSTVIGTANTMLNERHEELGPLLDRIMFLRIVTPPSAAGLRRMLTLPVPDSHPAAEITWDEIVAAQVAAREVVIPDEVLDALIEVRENLAKLGIDVSPRRLRQLQPIIQAEAFLAGESKANLSHLEIAVHCLWSKEAHIGPVQRAVVEIASPFAKEALDLSDQVVELQDRLNEIFAIDENDPTRTNQAVEAYKKVKKAGVATLKLEGTAGRAGRIVEDTFRRLEDLHHQVMVECYSIKNPNTLRSDIEAA